MGSDAKDVRDLTEPFYQLVETQPKTHAPPRIRFHWGECERDDEGHYDYYRCFQAIVESVASRSLHSLARKELHCEQPCR